MSYNLKCCSFYPNNFDASALISVGMRAYLGRDACVPRSGYDDHQASLTRQRGFPFQGVSPFLPFYFFTFKCPFYL